MEESLLDVTANSADTDCEERPVNRYGSPIARRSIGNVGETSQVPSSRVVSCDELLVFYRRSDCFGPLFQIEIGLESFDDDVRRWNLTFQEILVSVLQKMAPIACTPAKTCGCRWPFKTWLFIHSFNYCY